MKKILILFLLSTSTLFSQEKTYFYPNFGAMFILDSLDIPYLPIPERTGISPVGRTYSTQKGVELHNIFFNKNEFDFNMVGDRSPVNLMDFLNSYEFYLDGDKFLFGLYSISNTEVVGFAKVELKPGKYKSVLIFETHWLQNDTYGTLVLLEDNLGRMSFVNDDNNPVDYTWQPSFK